MASTILGNTRPDPSRILGEANPNPLRGLGEANPSLLEMSGEANPWGRTPDFWLTLLMLIALIGNRYFQPPHKDWSAQYAAVQREFTLLRKDAAADKANATFVRAVRTYCDLKRLTSDGRGKDPPLFDELLRKYVVTYHPTLLGA